LVSRTAPPNLSEWQHEIGLPLAAAKHYAERQNRATAERFWRDADGWRRYAGLNGLDLERMEPGKPPPT